ncbi:MAG: NAD(P)/FAD-dependent oxidoreductase [Lentisphaeria bacterium]|nr:NAD(P)/FAD-dependent oxidoreductase [Lentisphaeria bacterium]
MDNDVLILGAGLSGLAAAIRLAHFGRKVVVVEKHRFPGGLNSYYQGRHGLIDVGLHAITNFASAADKGAPLNRLLRQLRIRREDLDLCAQTQSRIETPAGTLRFTNDVADLESEIERVFPGRRDRFRRLCACVRSRDVFRLDGPRESTRRVLHELIPDPALQDALLLPLMYYGNAEEEDMDFNLFCILFRSILLEGFWRPRGGIKTILDLLLRRYEECGGSIVFANGVRALHHDGRRVVEAELSHGPCLRPAAVLSCAGLIETLRLCQPAIPEAERLVPGNLAYVETLFHLDRPARELGFDACTLFYSRGERFRYRRPEQAVDDSSGVICCPECYLGGEESNATRQVRITHLADYGFWFAAGTEDYTAAKQHLTACQVEAMERRAPGFREALVDSDVFTPRTICRYSGRLNGSIYGTPTKSRDGSTPLENLFVCGTDQGFLGIVGAMLSGVSIANARLLTP